MQARGVALVLAHPEALLPQLLPLLHPLIGAQALVRALVKGAARGVGAALKDALVVLVVAHKAVARLVGRGEPRVVGRRHHLVDQDLIAHGRGDLIGHLLDQLGLGGLDVLGGRRHRDGLRLRLGLLEDDRRRLSLGLGGRRGLGLRGLLLRGRDGLVFYSWLVRCFGLAEQKEKIKGCPAFL